MKERYIMTEFFRPPDLAGLLTESSMARISEASRRDYQVRVAMEQAVRSSEADIIAFTKELGVQDFTCLASVTLPYPFIMPSTQGLGTAHSEMKQFADRAYDVLEAYFWLGEWQEWFIVPYFASVDDGGATFHLGVFAEHFTQTVVE